MLRRLLPSNIEIYAHSGFAGGRALRFTWRGWQIAYGILRPGTTLDRVGKTFKPTWTGGWSWSSRRGVVAKCRHRVAA